MRDKVSSNKIRQLARSIDILYLAKKQKISYAGHIARCTGDNWDQKITKWAPYGRKRGRGRPALRWRQEMENKLGILWGRTAQNRKAWERTGEASA